VLLAIPLAGVHLLATLVLAAAGARLLADADEVTVMLCRAFGLYVITAIDASLYAAFTPSGFADIVSSSSFFYFGGQYSLAMCWGLASMGIVASFWYAAALTAEAEAAATAAASALSSDAFGPAAFRRLCVAYLHAAAAAGGEVSDASLDFGLGLFTSHGCCGATGIVEAANKVWNIARFGS